MGGKTGNNCTINKFENKAFAVNEISKNVAKIAIINQPLTRQGRLKNKPSKPIIFAPSSVENFKGPIVFRNSLGYLCLFALCVNYFIINGFATKFG